MQKRSLGVIFWSCSQLIKYPIYISQGLGILILPLFSQSGMSFIHNMFTRESMAPTVMIDLALTNREARSVCHCTNSEKVSKVTNYIFKCLHLEPEVIRTTRVLGSSIVLGAHVRMIPAPIVCTKAWCVCTYMWNMRSWRTV